MHEGKRPPQTASWSLTDPIEAARAYGIDISLLLSNLRLTPEERIRKASENAEFVRSIRGKAGR